MTILAFGNRDRSSKAVVSPMTPAPMTRKESRASRSGNREHRYIALHAIDLRILVGENMCSRLCSLQRKERNSNRIMRGICRACGILSALVLRISGCYCHIPMLTRRLVPYLSYISSWDPGIVDRVSMHSIGAPIISTNAYLLWDLAARRVLATLAVRRTSDPSHRSMVWQVQLQRHLEDDA